MTTPEIALDSIVSVAKEQVSSDLGSEVAILGLRRNTYYSLDGVGKRVWELIQTPVPVKEVLDQLLEKYRVEPDRCRDDLLHLLQQMLVEGLIEVGNGVGLAAEPRRPGEP